MIDLCRKISLGCVTLASVQLIQIGTASFAQSLSITAEMMVGRWTPDNQTCQSELVVFHPSGAFDGFTPEEHISYYGEYKIVDGNLVFVYLSDVVVTTEILESSPDRVTFRHTNPAYSPQTSYAFDSETVTLSRCPNEPVLDAVGNPVEFSDWKDSDLYN